MANPSDLFPKEDMYCHALSLKRTAEIYDYERDAFKAGNYCDCCCYGLGSRCTWLVRAGLCYPVSTLGALAMAVSGIFCMSCATSFGVAGGVAYLSHSCGDGPALCCSQALDFAEIGIGLEESACCSITQVASEILRLPFNLICSEALSYFGQHTVDAYFMRRLETTPPADQNQDPAQTLS